MMEGLCQTLPAPLVSLDQLLHLHSGNSLTWGRQGLLEAHSCQSGCETKVFDRMSWHLSMTHRFMISGWDRVAYNMFLMINVSTTISNYCKSALINNKTIALPDGQEEE